jgi:hypothetical protein
VQTIGVVDLFDEGADAGVGVDYGDTPAFTDLMRRATRVS